MGSITQGATALGEGIGKAIARRRKSKKDDKDKLTKRKNTLEDLKDKGISKLRDSLADEGIDVDNEELDSYKTKAEKTEYLRDTLTAGKKKAGKSKKLKETIEAGIYSKVADKLGMNVEDLYDDEDTEDKETDKLKSSIPSEEGVDGIEGEENTDFTSTSDLQGEKLDKAVKKADTVAPIPEEEFTIPSMVIGGVKLEFPKSEKQKERGRKEAGMMEREKVYARKRAEKEISLEDFNANLSNYFLFADMVPTAEGGGRHILQGIKMKGESVLQGTTEGVMAKMMLETNLKLRIDIARLKDVGNLSQPEQEAAERLLFRLDDATDLRALKRAFLMDISKAAGAEDREAVQTIMKKWMNSPEHLEAVKDSPQPQSTGRTFKLSSGTFTSSGGK